ncbi:hypothetical protein [Sphingobium sp. YR768]|jgi:hypothetical protein|uniref:hypothetical protein n=1 Tax=Sphingobium sp. YR768 TaxID=1884365 RepID=UPI0008BD9947|nr:hypothetical protein [Sphingobium sp. YR768]SEQ47761.1 hypothetical protein SAMN05518866_10160 [Sphingobium sp. YR768]
MREAQPRLLVGISAIAAHSRITETLAKQLINQRALPVWHSAGRPMTTANALEEWGQLRRAGKF